MYKLKTNNRTYILFSYMAKEFKHWLKIISIALKFYCLTYSKLHTAI